MRAVVRKWGNSLALRVPQQLAEEVGLTQDGRVELVVEAGRLVVVPSTHVVLDELLEGITDLNRHDAVEWGPPRGDEIW